MGVLNRDIIGGRSQETCCPFGIRMRLSWLTGNGDFAEVLALLLPPSEPVVIRSQSLQRKARVTSAAESRRSLGAAILFADSSPDEGSGAFTADEKKICSYSRSCSCRLKKQRLAVAVAPAED